MIVSLKQSTWCPPGLFVRLRSLQPTVSVPLHHPLFFFSLNSVYLSPTLYQVKKKPPLFECSAEPEHPTGAFPTPDEKKILDFYFWEGPLPEGGFGDCFARIIVTSVNYCWYSVFTMLAVDSFPCPWLLASGHLLGSFLFMVGRWAEERYEPPETDLHFWMSLFPVAAVYAIGHVATMVSLSKSSLFFTQLMRCGEPVFTMLLSSLFLLRGKWFPLPVYLSLLPIIGGCALAAITCLNFNMIGFIAAMIANLAFASVDILLESRNNKKKGMEITGPNYGACLSILSFLILTPFSVAIEGPSKWATGWKNAATHGDISSFFWFIVLHCLAHGAYFEDVYRFLPFIHPFPFFTLNNMKKIFLIVISITFVKPVQPIQALGAAIAILGFFLHSRELCKLFRIRSGSSNTIGFHHVCCN